MSELQWREEFPGVWKTTIGMEPFLDLLRSSGAAPKEDQLSEMSQPPFPLAQEKITVNDTAERLILALPMNKAEKLYGLGLNFKSLEIQQSVRHLHVDHFGGSDNGRTHAPVPFYISSEGYGVFVNLARYITVYAGGVHRKENHPPVYDRQDENWQGQPPGVAVEISIPKPGAEILIFAGPTLLEVIRRFNLYCGGGCMPARHGLGFWHRVHMKFSDRETVELIDDFERRGFPLDVVGLEPGWHSQAYPTSYEWNPERFPDPKRFVETLKSRGVHVNLWENCYVAPDCALGKQIEPFTGSHTGSWGGLVPDLMLPEARDVITRQHARQHVDIGVSGYKLDECDGFDQWLWPDHATFPSGYTGEQLRQVYGVLFQRTTTDMYRSRNRRTYGLVRAGNAGGVSLPYVLYNDYYDHRDFITALCSSSFCGLLWTPEARTSPTAEEWLRRMQSVCLSPLAMINAWSTGTKPWSYPDVSEAVKEAMLLRMRLIPYLYSAFAQYHDDGTPPVRAMVLEEGFLPPREEYTQGKLDATDNPYSLAAGRDVKNQFMLGPSLLVAPVFTGQTERSILFPAGAWFDFYTGEKIADGPVEMTIPAPLERIPLFVRDGGIIPLMPARLHNPAAGEKVDLELRHYGDAEGQYDLYDDDGETYNYEKGEFCRYKLLVQRAADGTLQGEITLTNSRSYLYDKMTWTFMTPDAF